MKSCFFIGHRDTPADILPVLQETIRHHITELGVTEFIVGNYGSFDRMAARAVIDAKAEHLQITLSLLIPYHPAERPVKTPSGFNNTFYPPGMEKVPRRFAIARANRYMVDHVDYLITYTWHPASNAQNLIEYARKREQQGLISIFNLSLCCFQIV